MVEPQRRHPSSDRFWHHIGAIIHTSYAHFQDRRIYLRIELSIVPRKGANKPPHPKRKKRMICNQGDKLEIKRFGFLGDKTFLREQFIFFPFDTEI